MIEIPTVLILGAGSSIHVGYPLGSDLINNLCKNRSTGKKGEYPNDWSGEEVDAFITRLSRAGYGSIDTFLETVPEQSEMGKFLLANEIKRHEYLDSLFPPNSSGWYRYLFNCLLDNNHPSGFASSNLSIITFNYDRSIEAFLHQSLMARFSMSSDEANDFLLMIPIVHVHGLLGPYPEVPYSPICDTETLHTISQEIKIIHEVKDQKEGFCSVEFEQAHNLLGEAERIIFLGFGFHQDNVRRFQFFSPENLDGCEVFATTRGMGPVDLVSLHERLEPYGFVKEMFNGNSCSNFFSHVTALS